MTIVYQTAQKDDLMATVHSSDTIASPSLVSLNINARGCIPLQECISHSNFFFFSVSTILKNYENKLLKAFILKEY